MTDRTKNFSSRRRLILVYWGVNIVLGLAVLAFVLR